ncbi:MarR family winged helix-turn-helix transcriptional regulator [Paenibacillus sp. GCM10023252]|uniref:MarR family winged helix-turn-helix transcriptional regulator n=1 Tax=Paenibacillus sp. GCM10023252 TaxID=3252649 RepID=UPI00361C0F6D
MEPGNLDKLSLMQELDEAFRQVRRLIFTEWNKNNVHGLGMTHGKMLILLSEQGPQKASALADALSITSGAITGIADRMIELGYIKRERSEQDRRIVMMELTEEGQALVSKIMKVRQELMLKLFHGMSAEEMSQAIDIFRRMSVNLEEENTAE